MYLTCILLACFVLFNNNGVQAFQSETSKQNPQVKTGLRCLCGDTFVNAYNYCCRDPSRCKSTKTVTSKTKRSIPSKVKEKSKKEYKDILIVGTKAKEFLKGFHKPTLMFTMTGKDNASEECCYEGCNLNEVSEYCKI